ncbi:MAG: putative porin [Muribaculaceae bacterium]|nr:putative porin [Muribaculaceae bacterium]
MRKKAFLYSYIRSLLASVAILLFPAGSAIAQRNLTPVSAIAPDEAASDASSHSHADEPVYSSELSYCWKVLPPLGLREPAPMDTLPLNYYMNALPSLVSPAWACTGNLGAEGQNMIFYERPAMSDFFFRDALEHWMPGLDKMRFYNTRQPMTLLAFNTSGGRETAQERLQGTFSGNINEKAQVGALLDYLYSKGSYNYQGTKDLTWGLSGSYLGDRYEMQAFYNHFNLLNKENGGIKDMLYITDPAELQGGISKIDPKSIPTNLTQAHTRLWGQELFINNRYKVGYWHEEEVNDTTVKRTYIPVSSFIYTLRYRAAKHLFFDPDMKEVRDYFGAAYLDPDVTRDKTTYWTVSNTVGISLLEGFHKYAKFGLAAYLTHEVRRYNMTADTLERTLPELGLDPFPVNGTIAASTTQQLAYVGAQLTKQRGSILTYEATGELGILGASAGDVKLDGRINTRFPFLNDSLQISAFGKFTNEAAPFLTQNYLSNHFIWKNNFGKQRDVTFGGEFTLGRTDTHFRASFSNLQNYIYFGFNGMPAQYGGSVQVLSLALRQNFKLGILHWDNRVIYQASSNKEVLPLPNLAVRSNLYLLFRIATLHVQLGVDCNYYTSYYSPIYNPATATFVNQNQWKTGNYPFCNAYANMKLSRARFYVMYSHANKGLFGGNNYFSMPFYPVNPARLQLGISVDFAN